MPSVQILFVDDDRDIVAAARMVARRSGMELVGASDPAAAWSLLAERRYDVILLDLNFARGHTSGEEGFRMLADLMANDPQAVVIVATGHSGINVAVEAMRMGASDFVIKPWSNDALAERLKRGAALAHARRAAMGEGGDEPAILLGDDPAIERVRRTIVRVGATSAPVLALGPAGSGKSLVIDLLRRQCAGAGEPCVEIGMHDAIDMGKIEEALAGSQGGTLILDHVETTPHRLQPHLAARLSGRRILAMARGDRQSVRAALDADLLMQLNTIEIELPRLSTRVGDALLLARHFADLFARRHGLIARTLSDEAARAIVADDWPDDVRGLRQAIERAVLLAEGGEIEIADLGLDAAIQSEGRPRAAAADLNLDRAEKHLIEAALDRHRFNISRAADELGLTRAALYRRMAKHGL
ncbi:response regulator [Stakelama sp. CBK3Z-3]|uniref:Response regulator n=1 Tax=Stakelama flava TaxID=2860338 RepID=A0ABS6XNN7_9SPHN|nr:response regulator [Stakelama flava]MBW4331363.1 response regulator [Stakelama flava]